MCCVATHRETLFEQQHHAPLTQRTPLLALTGSPAESCSSRDGGSDNSWLRIRSSQSKAKDADRPGLAIQVLNAWHLCKPRATPGSNLRADRSMICAQLEAAKVSRRHAQTISLSFPALSPPPFWGGFLTLAKPLQRTASQEPGSTLLPTLSSPARFNCWLGAGCRPSWAGIPRLGYSRQIGPPKGPEEKQRSPQTGSQRLLRPWAPSQWLRDGRGGGGETYVIPLPSPHPLLVNQGRLLDNCIPCFLLELSVLTQRLLQPAARCSLLGGDWMGRCSLWVFPRRLPIPGRLCLSSGPAT